MLANDQSHGIFSYTCAEALRAGNGIITYSQLITRMNRRTAQNVNDQSPQLVAPEPADKNLVFLTGREWTGITYHLISYDKKWGWILNAGKINGISAGNDRQHTELELQENGHRVEGTKAFANFSQVSGTDGYNNRQTYLL